MKFYILPFIALISGITAGISALWLISEFALFKAGLIDRFDLSSVFIFAGSFVLLVIASTAWAVLQSKARRQYKSFRKPLNYYR